MSASLYISPRCGAVRRSALMALVTVACLFGWAGCAAASAGTDTPAVSAVNGTEASRLPQPQLERQLAAMRAAGVGVVRSDAPWAEIEPAAPVGGVAHYDFSQRDAWVAALARHNLTWEPIIDYAVGWAKAPGCPGFCPPADNSTYATYAAAVAARYGAGGSFWKENRTLPYHPAQIFEVWNEENVSTFRIAASQYGPMYAATQTAIDLVDPTASVVVGGLADDSQSFDVNKDYPAWYVLQMFAADPGLKGHVDGFALHPYGATATDVELWVADFRRLLNAVGEASAPIDITEVGWTTSDSGHEVWRALMMAKLAAGLAHSNCGIRLLAPYDWINPGAAVQADFGLVDSGGLNTSLRASGTAWFAGIRHADLRPEATLCGPIQSGASRSSASSPGNSTSTPGATSASSTQPAGSKPATGASAVTTNTSAPTTKNRTRIASRWGTPTRRPHRPKPKKRKRRRRSARLR